MQDTAVKNGEKMRLFVRLLCAMGVSQDAVIRICALVLGDQESMDAVVDYIDENPFRSESEIIKKAVEIIG
ncbi:MAG: hypothetical protein IJE90_02365 [Clostridia bacterium]|nr:hypothetical protein [Clostridia bacterium]